jgi:hypothetical protein
MPNRSRHHDPNRVSDPLIFVGRGFSHDIKKAPKKFFLSADFSPSLAPR